MTWKELLNEFIYSISTNDKYSEYDSKKSFNRINKPEAEQLYTADDDLTVLLSDEASTAAMEGQHEIKLAWRHIKHWLQKYAPELYSSLQSPCTNSDLSDFQKDLCIRLPKLVFEFYKLTDGQSLYNENGSSGLLFGLKLLPLEEIMILTEHWRKVAKKLHDEETIIRKRDKVNELSKLESIHASIGGGDGMDVGNNNDGSYSSSTNASSHSLVSPSLQTTPNSAFSTTSTSTASTSIMPNQKCIPPGKIQTNYAHPMWIPIFTDEVGNCIGVDLCPPNPSNYGQVILFGRDFDTKYLVSDNFGDFMLLFANDLENGNWDIKQKYDESNLGDLTIGNDGEFVYIDKQDTKLEISYLDVLKKRCVDKWIATLEKDSNTPQEIKQIVSSLQEKKSTITLKNSKTIDDFIKSNLELIDQLEVPEEQVEFKIPRTQSKRTKDSTLKVVTESTEVENGDMHTVPI